MYTPQSPMAMSPYDYVYCYVCIGYPIFTWAIIQNISEMHANKYAVSTMTSHFSYFS